MNQSPLFIGHLAESSEANLSDPGHRGGCNLDKLVLTLVGLSFFTGHILVMDTGHQTGQHCSEIGESLSSQAPYPFIHHRPSIYACSQNSSLSQRDLVGT